MPLPIYVSVTKGVFTTTVLSEVSQIVAFATFLNAATDLSRAVKFAWDNVSVVDLDSPFVAGLVASLVPSVLSPACEDRRKAVIAALKAAKLPTQLAVLPTVTLFDHGDGKGYRVNLPIGSVVQETAPEISGTRGMTATEAQSLGNYVAAKMFRGLPPTVTANQALALWGGTKTAQALVDEELAG